jgi:hypothetical protein
MESTLHYKVLAVNVTVRDQRKRRRSDRDALAVSALSRVLAQ